MIITSKLYWEFIWKLPWPERVKFLEIDIRGRVLMMSVDIEFSLLAIIMYCAPNPLKQERRFKKMTMGKKIQNTIADLKKYNTELYKKYKTALDSLQEYNLVRNEMAHHTIEFHEPDNLRKFRTRFVGIVNNQETFFYREYSIEYISDFVNRFSKLNLVFAELVENLHNEYNKGISS